MVPTNDTYRVQRTDPPFDVPGMLDVELDPEGRLVWFAALVARVRGWGPPEQLMGDLESAARLLFR